MAGPKTRRGSTVKGNKSGEVASARVVPGTSSEDAGGNEPMASGANSVESKRLLRSDTRINAEKTEEGESGEAYVKPPPVPFVTRPKMLSHMGRAKKMTGASFNNTTTFHLFGKLPPELRTKIWKHAIPGPRVIQVKVKHVPSQYSSHLIGTAFNSSTPVPAMLHTCHESRVVAVLQYELGMRSHVQDPRIYVDFKRDIIYFGQINFDKGFTLSGLIRDVPMSELSKICFLGMSQDVWNFKPFCNGHVLMDFHSLERLTLAMERPDVTKHKNVMFVKPKEADFTVSAFYDPDMDDSDTGIFWPDEMEDIILENLIGAYDEHDREVPEVKYKVLAGADTKSTSKGKGKGKAVRK